jgi:hypothetical protein
MKIRKFASSALVSVAIFTTTAVPQPATAAPTVTAQAPQCPTEKPPKPDPQYLCGSSWLGPAVLPATGPVADLVRGYQRFGSLAPDAFLATYRPISDGKPAWKYPGTREDRGFKVINGTRLSWKSTFGPGIMLDRFGGTDGRFLAPAGTPFSGRSLPPDALNTPAGGPANNYRCYAVLKPFSVHSGPAAPGFGQTGNGDQAFLDPALTDDPNEPKRLTVQWLLVKEYLEARDVAECANPAPALD